MAATAKEAKQITVPEIVQFGQTQLADSPFTHALLDIFQQITSAPRLQTKSGCFTHFAGFPVSKDASSLIKLDISRYTTHPNPDHRAKLPFTRGILRIYYQHPIMYRRRDDLVQMLTGREFIGLENEASSMALKVITVDTNHHSFGRVGDLKISHQYPLPVFADAHDVWMVKTVGPALIENTAKLHDNLRDYNLAN